MPIASVSELIEAEMLAKVGSAGLGEEAGDEETGEGVGEPGSLAAVEEPLTLVDVPVLCTTIILSVLFLDARTTK